MWQYYPYFKDILLQKEANLLQEVENNLNQFNQSFELTKEERQLAEINEALSAIEEGTYGICIVCGSPIEEDVLRQFPETNRCLKDQNFSFPYE